MDTVDNTREIKPISFDAKLSGTERMTGNDITRLRSVTGSLAWIARQTRPDLAYRLQSSIKNASVATLADANAVAQSAHKGDQVKLRFPRGHFKWDEVGVITITYMLRSPMRRTTNPNRDDVTFSQPSRRSKTATATGTESCLCPLAPRQ